jgi:hypothetical protein
MSLRWFATNSDWVQISITADVALEMDPPSIGFAQGAAPPVTWHPSTWVGQIANTRVARIFVGPQNSGVVLTPGIWRVWWTLTDNPGPSVPVKVAGTLTIT